MRATFRARRDHVLGLIEDTLHLRTVPPDGAFYTMMDVAAYGSALRVAEALLEHGVITVPGGSFGSEAEKFLRVSFCADEATLTEGVRRVAEALAHVRQRQELPV
jgi:aspartate/methionine/tyrosine aminotransferase